MDLRQIADHELLSEVGKLVGSHRELTAKLVAHLGEVEERRLHLLAGYPSMFEFCTRELRMSEGEAGTLTVEEALRAALLAATARAA